MAGYIASLGFDRYPEMGGVLFKQTQAVFRTLGKIVNIQKRTRVSSTFGRDKLTGSIG